MNTFPMRRITVLRGHCDCTLWSPVACQASHIAADLISKLPSLPATIVYALDESEQRQHSGSESGSFEVALRNGRDARGAFTLDTMGFELIDLRRPITVFFADPTDVLQKVYPVATMSLMKATSAKKVIPFDHIIRDAGLLRKELDSGVSRGDPRCTPFLSEPVARAHNDYTVRSGFTRARQLLEPYVSKSVLDEALQGRFAIINFWYALEPVKCWPLAMCTWPSAQPQDVRTVRLLYKHRSAETYRVHYNPRHVWVHFSHMQPDEALLLKVFDSSEQVARFALHTAVELNEDVCTAPSAPQHCAYDEGEYREDPGPTFLDQARNRRSIEVRCLVFYDVLPEGFAEGFVAPHLLPNSADSDARLSLIRRDVLPVADVW